MAGRYAVIVAGGSQHQVVEGENLRIDLITGKKKGDVVTFDKVLMTGGEGGATIGTPHIAGAKVTAKVIDNGKGEADGTGQKGPKLFPLKRRPGDYTKHQGHRQRYTVVQITSITA